MNRHFASPLVSLLFVILLFIPLTNVAAAEKPIIITEVTPNIKGAEDFEFFEIYNRSDSEVNLDELTFRYIYTADSYDPITLNSINHTVSPGETVVLWFNKSDKTKQDFKDHFNVELEDSNLLEFDGEGFTGTSNGGDRGFEIWKEDKLLSRASYLGDEVDEDLSKHFKVTEKSNVMETFAVNLQANPGQVNVEQYTIPDPENNVAPQIVHDPVSTTQNTSNLLINAAITDDQPSITATLHYQTNDQLKWQTATMTTNDQQNYSAEIPSEQYLGSSLRYYIEVTDGTTSVTYPENKENPLVVSVEDTNDYDEQSLPALLVTELTPDTTNEGSKDGFEFIEIYNNTDQTINMKDYQIFYQYPNSSQLDWDLTDDQEVAPKQSFIAWIHNADNQELTLEDFNENYGTSLSENEVTIIESDGMANNSERTLAIATDLGQVISSSTYNNSPNDVGANEGITYKFSSSTQTMIKVGNTKLATPGTMLEGQVPDSPVEVAGDEEPPVINHTPKDQAAYGTPVTIKATVTDNKNVQSVQLSYGSTDASTNWKDIQMTEVETNVYEAVIPAEDTRINKIGYQIEASDSVQVTASEVYELSVEPIDYNPQQVPELLVTEVVPDSTNVGGLDGYEFIEVYNNSNQAVNFKDYVIRYRYPMEGPAADLLWKPEQEAFMIPSGESVVFWIINNGNQDKTVDDFNDNYGVSLQEGTSVFKIYSNGMSNSSDRGIIIATNTGHELSASFYNDEATKKDPLANKGIVYGFPTDGSKKMVKTSSATLDATPGQVTSNQVPDTRVQVEPDTEDPTVEFSNPVEVTDQENLSLTFDAEDNQQVKTVTLFYKNNEQAEYNEVQLLEDYDDGFYHHTIYSAELIGKEQVEYYVEVSDGTNSITSDVQTIDVISSTSTSDALRLNVDNEDVLSGTSTIKATGKSAQYDDLTLAIDGTDVSHQTYRSIENTAYFAFDVKKSNLYFKNGVTIGDETLFIFDDTINQYATITVPLEANRFDLGEKFDIAIRSGTKVSPFDQQSEENRDDFYVKNVRLVMNDGTTIYDPSYSNPDEELSIGDGGTSTPTVEFEFDVPEDQFQSKTFRWDTTEIEEGEHTISAKGADEMDQAEVIVDNSAPVITPSVNEEDEYKGNFTLDADLEDQYSGVTETEATLDGEVIELPYETSSVDLAPGEHTFTMKAVDLVGNEATVNVTFTVVEETPYAPEVISPTDQKTNVSTDPRLRLKVKDPTDDPLQVEFLQGFKHKPTDPTINVFTGSSATEPPTSLTTEDEQPLSNNELQKVNENDQQYMTTESIESFPYQRFEVNVGSDVTDRDMIELNWEGTSLKGRKVSMYVWNFEDLEWVLQQWKVAEEEDFELTARLENADFIKEGKVQVLIQDEIKNETPFDYTMVWMSDTQYYSESYPYIYERMTQWVADQKEALNIPYVFHTGDLVDEWDDEQQWNYADAYMKTLEDADIPYGVLAGNHDVDQKNNDYTEYSKYFGESRFQNESYYGGSYKDNRGHYDLISVNGNDFIMMYMGWGVTDEDIAWMNEVLAAHPNRMAFLNFHEYMLVSGNRSPLGNKLYEEVVKPNKNVVAVQSGHYHDSETLVSEIDDDNDGKTDRKVYQMLADYQGGPEGGQGYLRLLHVNPNENKIYVKTYSPYLDDYNYYNQDEYPGKDKFVIDLPLEPKEKQVATDAFTVNVYTDERIGSKQNVQSDDTASVIWKDLDESTNYSWYARVTDEFGGSVLSDIWSFTTEKDQPKRNDSDDDDRPQRDDDDNEDEEEKEEILIPEGPFEEWEPAENVAEDKTWKVGFNIDMDEDTVSSESIFIVDEDEEFVEADISLDSTGRYVDIDPEEDFNSGETYTLWITTKVKSKGTPLAKPVKFMFTIED